MSETKSGVVRAVKRIEPKKICLLASGGDAPGMNACMEAMFNYATNLKWEVWVSVMGYNGLVNDDIERATHERCTGISHMSGCVYKCGRCTEFTSADGFKKAVENIKRRGFDCIVVIGGNGSLQGMARLKKAGINVIGIPATIDNDVYFTKHSLGFSTACEEAIKLVDTLKATMQTNDRNHIVQLMGRDCDALALYVGIAAFANIVDITGKRHMPADVAQVFSDQRAKGNTSCMMVMQERKNTSVIQEAIDSAQYLQEVSEAADDKGLRMNTLGHLQRGATPSWRDRYLGVKYGVMAIDLINTKKFGVVVGVVKDELKAVELDVVNKSKPRFNATNYSLVNKIANRR